jgi:magnesium transporter
VEEQWTEILAYNTIPLGIILADHVIVTVSLVENQVISQFLHNRIKGFSTFKKNRFLLQILFRTAILYLSFLRQIDKKSRDIEIGLLRSTENKEVVKLLELGKSLVYFTTSLKSNDLVMEKLLRTWNSHSESELKKALQFYPEDEELLEDVIVENKQAIQMAEIYSSILNSMMDAFASIISNNLNLVMQILTVFTIVLALPTMVASFFGMNVALPFQNVPSAFWGTIGLSVALSSLAIVFFKKKKMF